MFRALLPKLPLKGHYRKTSSMTRPDFQPLPQVAEKVPGTFTIAIEGNIGAGKSTLINYFKQFDEVQVHAEPLDKWQNVNGENLLAKLYEDPKRWTFQVWTLKQSFSNISNRKYGKKVSFTRSIIVPGVFIYLPNNELIFRYFAKVLIY